MSDPRPEPATDPTRIDHAPPETAAGPSTLSKLLAEVFGTFLLVLGGVGSAVLAATHLSADGHLLGIGFAGVALAFGLTVVVGVYAWGPISGGHFNPAVTIGLAVAGRFSWRDVIGYLIAQIVGGIAGSSVIALIITAFPGGFEATAGRFASNGFDDGSPAGFGILGAIVVEIVFTAVFVLVILGVTHRTRGNPAMAGLAIGLTLTLIHLVTIPVDNTSVNPARSIAAAIYGGAEPLEQLWVFLVFPLVGAIIAWVLHRVMFDRTRG